MDSTDSQQPNEESTPAADAVPALEPEQVAPQEPHRQFRSRFKLAIFLFLATCLSTYIRNGFQYCAGVMAILFAHEMGHYLQARRYGVPATLPYFIPMPVHPFGTMGAVIVQGAGVADRKALFDIAISGPIAGLILALPLAYLGAHNLKLAPPPPPGTQGAFFADPLVLQWIVGYVHGPEHATSLFEHDPLYFAGWVGVFITALNLLPIGQLDGGHILYTLIGKRAHTVAILLLLFGIVFMTLNQYPAFTLLFVLLILMGPRHPPTADDSVPIGTGRTIVGWLTLAFLLIGFTPFPITDSVDDLDLPPADRQRIEQPAPVAADYGLSGVTGE